MISIDSITDIINNYENYLIDQWGVMHDGLNGYNHAIETINYLEKSNELSCTKHNICVRKIK